jgi:predicted DNA-binding protein YlxM (UPF0122 family)
MNKNGPRIVQAAERRRQAICLRREGFSYQAIADQLGMAKSSVHNAIDKAMVALEKEIEQEVKLLVALEIDRLDSLQQAIWCKAMEGNLGSVDRVLKIMDRRSKLLGLDAPTKIAATTPDGESLHSRIEAMSVEERRTRINELTKKIGTKNLLGEEGIIERGSIPNLPV